MEVDTAGPATAGGAHSIASLSTSLSAWLTTIGSLLQALERHLATIAANSINDATSRADQDKAVLDMVNEVGAASNKDKEKSGGNVLGGSSSWTRDLSAGLMGKFGLGGGSGGGGGGGGSNDQDTDMGGPASGGRGGKGGNTRARKRGRI